MHRIPRSARRAGVTLVELMVVTALLSFVILAMYELIATSTELSMHSAAWANLVEWGQQGLNGAASEASTIRKLYGNDAAGLSYRASVPPPSTHKFESNTRLPSPQANGTFRRDLPGAEQTGNLLLFCRERAPFDADVGGGVARRADVFALVCYYLSPVNRPVGRWPRSLLLARWESAEYADYGQVTALIPAERTPFVQQLYATRGIRYLWRLDQPAGAAFYPINAAGAIAAAPTAPFVATEASNTNVIPNLGLGFASVAWNRDNTSWVPEPVPQFARADAAGDGFPNGFEIQVVGPSGARTILLRLVIADYAGVDRDLDTFGLTAIANAREF